MATMIRWMIRRLIDDRRGATAIEYGLIVALIVIGMVAALSGVGGKNGSIWSNMTNKVSAVQTS